MVKDEYYDQILQKLEDLATRYGIKLHVEHPVDSDRDLPQLPEDFTWGPQGDCGFSAKARMVYAHSPMPEILLHEIVHCVLGEPSRAIDEAYLLMPFEMELARWMSRGEKWAGYFMKCVTDYQLVTEVGHPGDMLRVWGEQYMDLPFWKKGLRRVKRLKLLDRKGEPTFKRPQWIGSGVCSTSTNWDPDNDSQYA